MKTPAIALAALAVLPHLSFADDTLAEPREFLPHLGKPLQHQTSHAYKWLDVVLEASARDVERIGARPTILSRQMQIPINAKYDTWACYDHKAVGTMFGGELRRPAEERTLANQQTAIAYAIYRTAIDVLPYQKDYIPDTMKAPGYDPGNPFPSSSRMEPHSTPGSSPLTGIASNRSPWSTATSSDPGRRQKSVVSNSRRRWRNASR